MNEGEPTLKSTPGGGRLPAGNHKLPQETVLRSQRQRMLDAMAHASVAEQ
jgi:hypothetical protein